LGSQEKAEEQRYHGVLETAAHFRARYFAAMGVYMGCFHWALGLGMTMWLWYGSRLIDLGELTVSWPQLPSYTHHSQP